MADPVGGANRARKFWSRPLTRNHALIITANKIETVEQPENSMEIDVLSLEAGFLVRYCSQIHDRLSFLG